MYQKLCSNCPVKTKPCVKLTAVALQSRQTCKIASNPPGVTAPSSANSCIIRYSSVE